jgi:hypothetical protein
MLPNIKMVKTWVNEATKGMTEQQLLCSIAIMPITTLINKLPHLPDHYNHVFVVATTPVQNNDQVSKCGSVVAMW